MRSIAILLALCAAAHADSRAWTAAKQVLPDGLQAVVGINAGPIRSSQLYEKLWPTLMAKAGDAQAHLDQIKSTCKLDVPAAIDSMVVGLEDDSSGVIVIALKGTTQKDIDSCFDKLTKADGKPMTTSKTGNITKYSSDGKDLYIRWLGKDIGAMATSPDDKDLLTKLTAGGSKLRPLKTDAALWVTANKQEDLDQLHAKMSRAYGYADLKSGSLATEIHVVLDSAKAASEAAAQASQQVADAKKSGALPPVFKPLIDTLAIKAAGSELVVSARMAEDDAIALISAVSALLGH